jgi:hypothetical protein
MRAGPAEAVITCVKTAILDFSDYERRAVDHGCQEVVARTPEQRHRLDQYIGAEKRVQQILCQVARRRRDDLLMDRRFGRSVKLGITAADEYVLLLVTGCMDGLGSGSSASWRVILVPPTALNEAQAEAIRRLSRRNQKRALNEKA